MSDAPADITLPYGLAAMLAPIAAQFGITLPGMGRIAPTIDAAQPMRALALEVGRLVSRQNIFLKGDEIVTVEADTGRMRRMTARRFSGWLEEFAAVKAGPRQRRDSLAAEDTAQILETDIFRGCLRPLAAIHTMRLPVLRKSGAVEFLDAGYDAETGIFTAPHLPYAMDWTLDRATTFLNAHGAEYCFTWRDDQPGRDVSQNRNWAVQIAAMLGIYCAAMFEPGTPRPIILYVGNKPGTGKSTLAAMALMPVHATAAATAIPKDDDRLISALEAIARTRWPYVFFDDVAGGLFNNALYEFVLSRSHAGRVMGGNAEIFEEPNVTQVFATGNDIRFDENLKRRVLVVELFLDTEVRGRRFKRVINTTYLARPDVRADFLSALCAIVKHYAAKMTAGPSLEAIPASQPLESFETWSAEISQMVQLAGYCDPLAAPNLAGAGALDDDEMKDMLIAVASAAPGSCVFSRRELVDAARELGVLESIVGAKGDPDPDQAATKRWGRQLGKYRGQIYLDEKGRRFRFSHRRQKTGATYPLNFLVPEDAEKH